MQLSEVMLDEAAYFRSEEKLRVPQVPWGPGPRVSTFRRKHWIEDFRKWRII